MNVPPVSVERVQKCVVNFEIYRFLKKAANLPHPPLYLPNNSITYLPDSSANKSPTRPLQSTYIRIPTSYCTNTACSCEGIGVGDAAQWYGNVAALVFPRPPYAAAWVFSGTEAPG